MIKHANVIDDEHNHDRRRRALGQFYTPATIGRRLAEAAVERLAPDSDVVRLVDPFCGDGRLVVWALEHVARNRISEEVGTWQVDLWDADEEAVSVAAAAVAAAARQGGLSVRIRSQHADSFAMFDETLRSTYDLVVTNPPWEALKPDRRELVHLDDAARAAYLVALRAYDGMLAEKFPVSQPTKKFSGWGTNLSRAGLELSLRLLKPHGVAGIVLPFTVLGDQVSEPLREWLFRHHAMDAVDFFPAEARQFEGVDQSVVACLIRGRSGQQEVRVTRFGHGGTTSEHVLNPSMTALQNNGYRLPVDAPGRLVELLLRLSSLPTLNEMESRSTHGLWLGRELDETGWTEYVTARGDLPFVKGRAIGRFRWLREPDLNVDSLLGSRFESVKHHRVAWRDVSRRNQKRRMQATILPPGVVTGNSLHVGYYRDDDRPRLFALAALMNSLPFELQMRAGLATGHMSLGAVRQVHVPALDSALVSKLAPIAERLLNGDQDSWAALDWAAGAAYGLGEADLRAIERYCSGENAD